MRVFGMGVLGTGERGGFAANAKGRATAWASAGIQGGRWRREKMGPSGPPSVPCCVMSLVFVHLCAGAEGGGRDAEKRMGRLRAVARSKM